MVRLRINIQDADSNTRTLKLKSTSKQTTSNAVASKSRPLSPLKTSSQDFEPRKQRILKRVENNSVLLTKSNLPPSIRPSKFSKARSSPLKEGKDSSSLGEKTIHSGSLSRLSPSKHSEALKEDDLSLTFNLDALLKPLSTRPIQEKLQLASNLESQVAEDRDETASILKPPVKRSRRRLVIESDSDSESDSKDIFASLPSLPDGPPNSSSHDISANTDQSSKLSKKHSVDLQSALLEQGFRFEEPIISDSESNVTSSRPGTSSGLDPGALLSFEPTRSRSPVKLAPERPVTPTKDSAPTKLKLKSPTKTLRIPKSPHKPESDAFWCPSAVNDWVDQHSPQKAIKSPVKSRFELVTKESVDLTEPKSPQKSPAKAQRQARKDFNERKHGIAANFLADLDLEITGGQIAELSKSTGGVQIQWSNKLHSTAGRAHWRKRSVRKQHTDGSISTTVSHTVSIELAEKVLDEEHRLVNTIAHEFCHLATFMIDGVKTNPHGKEFKEWARKCSVAYRHRGIQVTTKHSYEIDYKYVWECSSCGIEYKRHSKSIDTAKQRCGGCKSGLVQTRPVPRKTQISDYQTFVKENFQSVKSRDKGASHGMIMETLGRLYRESKIESKEKLMDLEDLALDLQAIQL